MNYLAHMYLSGDDPDILVGNYIADGLRKKHKALLPDDVLRGVELHYKIDEFTDTHPKFGESKKRLFDTYGHYSNVIIDLFYDHLLAKSWGDYHVKPLNEFASDAYGLLEKRLATLPERSRRFLYYMTRNNTLVEYSSLEGIGQVLHHFSHRTSFDSGIDKSINDLREQYEAFDKDFRDFFPEIIDYVLGQKEMDGVRIYRPQ